MIKRTSTLARAAAILTLGGQITLFAACSDVGTPTQAVETQAAFSGEQLFRGIFFGEGQVGRMLPEIWNGKSASSRAATPEKAAEIQTLENQVVARVRAANPALFSGLEAAVRSGDHFQVEKALVDAGSVLKGEIDKLQMVEQDQEFASVSVDIETYIYAVVAVVVFLVISVIDITPNIEVEGQPLIDGEGSKLERDVVVDLITTRFATR